MSEYLKSMNLRDLSLLLFSFSLEFLNLWMSSGMCACVAALLPCTLRASCAAGGHGLMTQLSAQVFWTWLLCVICFVGVLTGCLCAGKLWISCSHFFLLTSLSPPISLGSLPSFPSLHFHFFCPFCQCVPVVMVPVAGVGTVVLSLPSWACLSCLAF